MKKFTALLLLGLVAGLLVACGPQEAEPTLVVETKEPAEGVIKETDETGDTGEGSEPALLETPVLIAEFEEASPELREILPEYDDAAVVETDSGLRYVILEEGTGDSPQLCDTVDAHYSGYLTDGTPFDSSRDRGETFQFPLGQGSVIAGWDEGFALLNPGTTAILMIPPALGYGTQDRGTIPPNSTLYFDVELVDVISNRPTDVADADFVVDEESGVKYATLTEGLTPITDDQVMVLEFTLWDSNGCVASSTAQGNGTIAFDRGGDRMFGAMITTTADIQIGENRQMVWPQESMVGTGLNPITYTIEVTAVDALDPPPATFEPVDDAEYTEVLTTGVKYYVLTEGTGDALLPLDTIDVIYHIWTLDGELLTSTIYSGQTGGVPYLYGQNSLPGFDEGLEGAKIGEIRQVLLPSDLVPPDPSGAPPEELIMQIEILGKQSTIAPSE